MKWLKKEITNLESKIKDEKIDLFLEKQNLIHSIMLCGNVQKKYLEYLKKKNKQTVVYKYSDYSLNGIKFDYSQNTNDSYCVTLSKNNKKLIFREFYFGCDNPDIDTVMETIKDDYLLFKSSPTLSKYKLNRGDVENIELDYEILTLDVKSMIQFFGKEYLNSII